MESRLAGGGGGRPRRRAKGPGAGLMATNEEARVRYKYDMQIVHGDRRLGDHGTWMRRCPHKGRKGEPETPILALV